jgi:hypothetical protein
MSKWNCTADRYSLELHQFPCYSVCGEFWGMCRFSGMEQNMLSQTHPTLFKTGSISIILATLVIMFACNDPILTLLGVSSSKPKRLTNEEKPYSTGPSLEAFYTMPPKRRAPWRKASSTQAGAGTKVLLNIWEYVVTSGGTMENYGTDQIVTLKA